MRIPILACATLALAACQQGAKEQPPVRSETAGTTATSGPVKGVDRSHQGKPAPNIAFQAPDGHDAHLADFAGKPLLVNLWASWCAPCVKELPTLDRESANPAVQVLAISQDSGPHASVVAFLQAHRIDHLRPYQDAKMAVSGALGSEVLPTSILFDAQGKEVWRFIGDLDWTSPQAAKLLSEAGAARPAQ